MRKHASVPTVMCSDHFHSTRLSRKHWLQPSTLGSQPRQGSQLTVCRTRTDDDNSSQMCILPALTSPPLNLRPQTTTYLRFCSTLMSNAHFTINTPAREPQRVQEPPTATSVSKSSQTAPLSTQLPRPETQGSLWHLPFPVFLQ